MNPIKIIGRHLHFDILQILHGETYKNDNLESFGRFSFELV